jgi:hypothetical protein
MNFEKLASNLNEEEKKLESQILPYCNPKQIANELMSDLEKASPINRDDFDITDGVFLERGSLFTSYLLWFIRKPQDGGYTDGPLVNCSDRSILAPVLLNLIKKYITDDIIKLGLYKPVPNPDVSAMAISAIISRADVEKIKSGKLR